MVEMRTDSKYSEKLTASVLILCAVPGMVLRSGFGQLDNWYVHKRP